MGYRVNIKKYIFDIASGLHQRLSRRMVNFDYEFLVLKSKKPFYRVSIRIRGEYNQT